MNIETLYWDSRLLSTFKIPPELLPEIRSSSEIYGKICKGWPLEDVTISGVKNQNFRCCITSDLTGTCLDFRQSAIRFTRPKLLQRRHGQEYLQKRMLFTL